jgi:hypothetical protein
VSYGIIYKATGPGGKVYVGQTTETLKIRKGKHKYRSLKGDQRTPFQSALLDEGFSNFTWEEIDRAESQEELDRKEKQWIARYQANNPQYGYNTFEGGSNPRHTPETRRKISKGNKEKIPWCAGKHLSEDHRRKLSEAKKGNKSNRGRHFTEEHRRKLSEAQKGKKNHNFGKHSTPETRQKMSEARKGSVTWNKGKTGVYSEETRRKISETMKKRWAERLSVTK